MLILFPQVGCVPWTGPHCLGPPPFCHSKMPHLVILCPRPGSAIGAQQAQFLLVGSDVGDTSCALRTLLAAALLLVTDGRGPSNECSSF